MPPGTGANALFRCNGRYCCNGRYTWPLCVWGVPARVRPPLLMFANVQVSVRREGVEGKLQAVKFITVKPHSMGNPWSGADELKVALWLYPGTDRRLQRAPGCRR